MYNTSSYAISACLIGYRCRYNVVDKKNDFLINLLNFSKVLPICPEIFGGMGSPRKFCKIIGGSGIDVLTGSAFIVDSNDKDCSKFFIDGAYFTLKIIRKNNIKKCFLKFGSPSCGCGLVSNFSIEDDCGILQKTYSYREVLGVTAALLIYSNVFIEKVL